MIRSLCSPVWQGARRKAKDVAKWNNHASQYEMAQVAAATVPFTPPTPTYFGPGYEYRYTATSPAKPLGETYPASPQFGDRGTPLS